jgi:hypothetical protein
MQYPHRAPNALRTNGFTCVECSAQTSGAGALEHCFELDRRVTSFRAAKPKCHYAVADCRDRPVGYYSSLLDRSLASEIEDQPHADA